MCRTIDDRHRKIGRQPRDDGFEARGPPVDTPMTTTICTRLRNVVAAEAARAGTARAVAPSGASAAATTFATSSSAMSNTFSVASAVGFCTKSIAPASRPLSTRSLDSAAMLTMTIGTGRDRHLPADELDAVRRRHDQIAGHDVRPQPLDQLERLLAVAGRPDHLDGRAARQHLLHDLPDVGRIVDDEHSNRSTHEALSTLQAAAWRVARDSSFTYMKAPPISCNSNVVVRRSSDSDAPTHR